MRCGCNNKISALQVLMFDGKSVEDARNSDMYVGSPRDPLVARALCCRRLQLRAEMSANLGQQTIHVTTAKHAVTDPISRSARERRYCCASKLTSQAALDNQQLGGLGS